MNPFKAADLSEQIKSIHAAPPVRGARAMIRRFKASHSSQVKSSRLLMSNLRVAVALSQIGTK